MLKIGVAQTDITPTQPVWLTGFGNRDHRSEGVYLALKAGAVSLSGDADEALVLTADVIGYGPTFAAGAKMRICEATGLLPRQVVMTATHTHCAPFFWPWAMPGEVEPEYAAQMEKWLVQTALAARANPVPGEISFSRGRSTFGVNRRLPDGHGHAGFGPNPDGPIDRDLDTLWFQSDTGRRLGSLTVYGCHPTSVGGYLIGGDYPGFLCRDLGQERGAPALYATGCGGNIRPWYNVGGEGFAAPTHDQVEEAAGKMMLEVLQSEPESVHVAADDLRVTGDIDSLLYADLPTRDTLEPIAADDADPLRRRWSQEMLGLIDAGGLPRSCPHEIQVLQLCPDLRLVFLGGEVLTEIGMHIKRDLLPATTVTVAYSNGLVAYVPGEDTYDLGGYEVSTSHVYYLRPAPFARDVKSRIVARTQKLVAGLPG